MKSLTVWHGHSTRPSLPAGTAKKGKKNLLHGRKSRLITPPVKRNRAFPTGNALLYIANLDIAHADNMKFVLMAFDEGTGLTPHRAPGNAILTALEGKAIIGYEGKDYELNAGESFRFDKNGLHSVTAQGKFKMSLLLVIE